MSITRSSLCYWLQSTFPGFYLKHVLEPWGFNSIFHPITKHDIVRGFHSGEHILLNPISLFFSKYIKELYRIDGNITMIDAAQTAMCMFMSWSASTITSFSYQWSLLLTWFNLDPAWISNFIHHKIWDEITYPFPNFNGCTVEVWEWMNNFTLHFTGHVITFPCRGPWAYFIDLRVSSCGCNLL